MDKILSNLEEIKKLKANGASTTQIIEALHMSRATFYKYVKECPEVAEALEDGKLEVVGKLESELYRKAMPHTLTTTKTFEKNGEITTETTVKEVDGDLGALIFMLKNLSPEQWVNDPKLLEIKKKELELKEKALEQNLW